MCWTNFESGTHEILCMSETGKQTDGKYGIIEYLISAMTHQIMIELFEELIRLLKNISDILKGKKQ